MTEPMRLRLERALGLGLAALAALIAVTCASSGRLERTASAPASVGISAASAAPRAVLPPAAKGAAAVPAAASLTPPASQPAQRELARFFADLAALEGQRRKQSVRLLWLGDSHTAADYLTGTLRARLQARFAVGGPGFLRVGLKPYRHTQLHWSVDGPWKIEPVPPPRRTPFDDGVFGLGGLRAVPDGAPAQASFELDAGAALGRVHWQLWFSLKDGASFRLTLAGVSQVVTRASGSPELPGAGFSSLALESAPTDKLELLAISGGPKFYGLIAEGSQPGFVLDTVGIDGARVATLLAWGQASFEAAVRLRGPSLVALAFGTNEAFDADKIEKYRGQYQALLARVRAAVPDADCLIVGPPDAVAVTGGSEPRVTAIDELERSVASELGCYFVSQLEIMGGSGSYARWAQKSPPLARGDRLHLTAKGYEVVGNALADRLLEAYAKRAQ